MACVTFLMRISPVIVKILEIFIIYRFDASEIIPTYSSCQKTAKLAAPLVVNVLMRLKVKGSN